MTPIRRLALAPLAGAGLLLAAAPGAADAQMPDPASSDHDLRPDRAWMPLFDGQSLDGWTATGDPDAWAVEDGAIAITEPGSGGWLRTTRTYRDFELTLDFWLPEGGNSGLGLRGSSGGDPAFTGFEIQIFDSGDQEPGLRSCGAVYEAIEPDAMAVGEPGSWNTYRVRLVGDTLDVWLNGQRIHEGEKLDDRGFFRKPSQPKPLNERATTGYIAVQDHGDPFRFRNIRIRDLSLRPEPEGMTHLIRDHGGDGEPDGWFAEDKGSWTVASGALVGRGGPGHLFSRTQAQNFELRGLVKVNENGNSGIYFRARPNPQENNPWPIGYEAQIDQHDPGNFTGCIYDRAKADRDGPITRDGAWFDYIIRAEGDRIRTWINGEPMVDAELDDFDRGRFALQTHHEGNEIMFKDLRIVRLGSDPGRDGASEPDGEAGSAER